MGLIRLLFAIAVVVAHTVLIHGIRLVGSIVAVQSFFILSGFYMTMVWKEKYLKNKNAYFLFLSNRLLKLFPTYFIILVGIITFSFIQHYLTGVITAFGGDYGQLAPYYYYAAHFNIGTWVYFVFTNLFIIGQDTALFLGLGKSGNLYFTPNFSLTTPALHLFLLDPVMWVISLEIFFYILAPFIINKSNKALIILGSISVGIRLILYYFGYKNDPWNYRFFPSEFVFFILGIFAYRMYERIRHVVLNKPIVFTTYALLILFIIFYQKFNIPDILFYVVFTLLIPVFFIQFKNSKIDRYIGDLSYPVYVSHIFLLSILVFFNVSLLYNSAVTLVITSIVFSAALKYFILDRIEKYRQRRLKSL